jgi:hypothetical protein
MKWFKKIFKGHEPVTVDNPILGSLTNDLYGNWNGTLPTGLHGPLDFSIRTGDVPPSDEVSEWISETLGELTGLWDSVRPRAFEGLDDFTDGTTMEQLFESMRVEFAYFWDCSPGSESWELSCSTDLDDHIFSFVFKGKQYQDFRMDG